MSKTLGCQLQQSVVLRYRSAQVRTLSTQSGPASNPHVGLREIRRGK